MTSEEMLVVLAQVYDEQGFIVVEGSGQLKLGQIRTDINFTNANRAAGPMIPQPLYLFEETTVEVAEAQRQRVGQLINEVPMTRNGYTTQFFKARTD